MLWLVRHAETEWSADGRHTGRTDLPLSAAGERAARALRARFEGRAPQSVLCSPLQRARATCALAGLTVSQLRDELMEWDYGDYEGLTTAQIRRARPDWDLWRDGCPGGESPAQVGARVDVLVSELAAGGADGGDHVLVAHGHVLRVLAARWIGLQAASGALLALSTASVSTLGWERQGRVLWSWNLL